MLSKVLLLIIAFNLMLGCSSMSENKAVNDINNYKNEASKIVKLAKENLNASLLMEQSLNTINAAKLVFNQYAQKKPNCKNLINFVWNNRFKMMNSLPEDLEVNYHEGKALPKHDDECHDIKELVVHPATVYSLAKHSKNLENSKEQILDEMEEVLEHLDIL